LQCNTTRSHRIAVATYQAQQSFHEQVLMTKPLVPQQRRRRQGEGREFEMHTL
jgi:hypothetical protein